MRKVIQQFKAVDTSDGAGVRLKRSIGLANFPNIDPFLLLDEFSSANSNDYIAGFPPHPHRGFETVTYMIDGMMEHKDSAGNNGLLRSGSVQWMSAGKGVLHSEMPIQKEGLMRGFQLWINLPAKDKMMNPRYQNIEPEEIPVVKQASGAIIKIIAGNLENTAGPVKGIITNPFYWDLMLPPETQFETETREGQNVFAYPFEGEADFGTGLVPQSTLVLFSNSGKLLIKTEKKSSRILLIGADPINEPIARGGPFVMNTRDEISQAVKDYESGKFGIL